MRSVIILQQEFSANHCCPGRIDCQRGKNAPRPPETDPTAYCGNFTLYDIARDRRGGLKREKPGEDVDADERNERPFPRVRRFGPCSHRSDLESWEKGQRRPAEDAATIRADSAGKFVHDHPQDSLVIGQSI